MKTGFLLFSALLIGFHCFGSKIDTTIFSSDFEKQLFLNKLNDATLNSIEFFLAIDYKNDYSSFINRYERFAESLKKETETYAVKKKLKSVYKDVHAEFFKQYKIESFFNDIFLNGNYNCVGASAMYSLLLTKLNIPHIIKEKPDHVYIIADPENTNFLIETTLPSNGLVEYDKKVMSNYIEYLHGNKIIPDEEFKKESVDALFAKYFLADKTITIKQLAGIQYYNKGVFLYNKSLYADALKNFEKAELLYPSEIIKYIKSSSLLNVLNEEGTTKEYHGKNLAKYLLTNKSNPGAISICQDYFNSITNELVINHPNIQKYDQYFIEFKHFADTAALNEFENTYYFYKAYSLYNHYEFASALQYLKKAYQVNPDNIHTRQLITDIIFKSSGQQKNFHNSSDSIEKQIEYFPFLKKEKSVQNFLIYSYSMAVANAYNENNSNLGNEYLEKLESLSKENQNLDMVEEAITQAYNNIATYFYGKGEYAASIKILDRGLVVLPNSETLKKRRKSISNYKPEANWQVKKTNNTLNKPYILKYKDAQAFAKSHSDTINAGTNKYLHGKWKIHFSVNSTDHKISINDQYIIVSFQEDNKLITYESSKVQIVGSWKYETSNCTLSLVDPSDKASINILIQKITENHLNGVVTIANFNDDVREIILTKVYDKPKE